MRAEVGEVVLIGNLAESIIDTLCHACHAGTLADEVLSLADSEHESEHDALDR
ncbi:hypothetical protein [Porphyromonas gingivalis]|uniref:Uncharacterized protein n=1 Tax=Porphyromonas gingivalis TaxID=837 RepID=A0AAE9XAJ7_PORGN|nr:hypothetical protein [Porphyromonas gingivalis]WCG02188.1 hypothetical protein NY151_05730 [Porphyromonas gingivalis]